eukprot:TRINITY_DN49953_c0_g1_i3.p2 TRINITY_DN49953_c0_g1~~TRINITY_DN49953_c0_g1_i3.p2  ORF type:complete len:186 (-),score=44.12 TRINITY_DN49953_c0_g1_i3:2-559(-)
MSTASIRLTSPTEGWSLTREELLTRAAHLAVLLAHECGLAAGEAVCLADPELCDRLELLIACRKLGAVIVTCGQSAPKLLTPALCARMRIKAIFVSTAERRQQLEDELSAGSAAAARRPETPSGHAELLAGLMGQPRKDRPEQRPPILLFRHGSERAAAAMEAAQELVRLKAAGTSEEVALVSAT